MCIRASMKRYLEKLNAQKRELTKRGLAGDENVRDEIEQIDADIIKYNEKLKLLFSI